MIQKVDGIVTGTTLVFSANTGNISLRVVLNSNNQIKYDIIFKKLSSMIIHKRYELSIFSIYKLKLRCAYASLHFNL